MHFGTTHLEYRYSWQYETAPKDDIEAKNMSEDFLEVLVKYGNVTGFIPAYSNQAITFTGEDMGGDKAMMEVLLYILIVIIAFVFAVTTNNTITKEASVDRDSACFRIFQKRTSGPLYFHTGDCNCGCFCSWKRAGLHLL